MSHLFGTTLGRRSNILQLLRQSQRYCQWCRDKKLNKHLILGKKVSLDELHQIHAEICTKALNDHKNRTAMIKVYGDYGLIQECEHLWECAENAHLRDAVMAGTMMAAYHDNKKDEKAVEFYHALPHNHQTDKVVKAIYEKASHGLKH
mmetsp:Transcript_59780/g.98696  ORF Transcript_59780/g.98696 Transcript_59780/m.98696 type:complete len:148 (+) Transcript_59780:1924-2367(+)